MNDIPKDTEKVNGAVVNSNDNILSSIDNYLMYIRDCIKQIIIKDDLHYSDPMEKKKVYPDFTYTQFLYLLSRLFDRVYSVNLELLYDSYNDKYNKVYNMDKVRLCYEVYDRLCIYYGFNCSVDGFYRMSGIDERTLKEWLSSGRSDLAIYAYNNAKKTIISRFENSKAPLLNLAAANYKYQLSTPENNTQTAAAADILPDLLQLPEQETLSLPGEGGSLPTTGIFTEKPEKVN